MPISNKGISTPIAIAIILLLAISVGGITLWQYSKIELPETKTTEKEKKTEEVVAITEEIEKEITEKDDKLYPRSSELFGACFGVYHQRLAETEEASEKLSEEVLEEISKIREKLYYEVSDEEVEKAIEGINSQIKGPEEEVVPAEVKKAVEGINSQIKGLGEATLEEQKEMRITAKQFENNLETGYPLPEYFNDLIFLCRNSFMDEKSRLSEYDEICKKTSSCCNLPELKDTESAEKLAKKMINCLAGTEVISSQELYIAKLKYGYLIVSNEYFGGFGAATIYLTNDGCIVSCSLPYMLFCDQRYEIIKEINK